MRTFILRTRAQALRLGRFINENWKEAARVGKPLEVVVSAFQGRRDERQNRRYWWRLGVISEQAMVDGRRYPKETWHELFKRKFIGYEELPGGGMLGLSTRLLSAEDFDSYDRKVEVHAVEVLNVIFPEREVG